MTRKDLTSFEIDDQGFKLKIERGAKGTFVPPQAGYGPPAVMMGQVQGGVSHTSALQVPTSGPAQAEPPSKIAADYIKSPIVGTFYASATPESEPFVKPGSVVSAKTVVCIIEAMKVMNEITAEMEGEILELMIENGKPVEYGQPLFKIKKA